MSKYSKNYRLNKEKYIKYLEVHLTDHCNLNCKGCCHFAPIAPKNYLDLNEFEKDIKQLSKIINKKLKRLILLGGEPLLHPNVINFLEISKKFFPNTDVQILTNGILLSEMDENFWQTCKKLNIQIDITMYPIKFDYKSIVNRITNYGIRYFIYDDGIIERKKFDKYCFDIYGRQDLKYNYYEGCIMAKDCAFLSNGKIYPCQLACNIKFLNEYFGENFEQVPEDYIDIYQVKNENEIYDFLTRPIPFCRYCDFTKKEKEKWSLSKKIRSEW